MRSVKLEPGDFGVDETIKNHFASAVQLRCVRVLIANYRVRVRVRRLLADDLVSLTHCLQTLNS